MAEATSVVSELATVVPEDLQVENDGIPQAEEDLVDLTTPPTNNPVQEEAATLLVESKETVEISSTAEPSVAETLSDVVSELATVVPEDLHIEDGGIPQAEEDFVDSPALTNDPVQEDAVAPIVESEETTAEPSEGETTSVLSELATIVPEELQIENGGIAHAEEDLVDPPRPTDDGHVQEKVVTPLVESKTNEISSTTEPSTPTMATIVSETSMEPPEDLQIENAGVAQADVDPPAPTDPVQDDAVAPLVESKEATAEPSVAETASVVSEPAIPVPEELEIEDVIAQAEEELVDLPLLPTDDPVEEAVVPLVESGKAIEFSSTAETLMTEIASVISELSKEVLEVLSIDSDGDVQEDHSVDLALETVGTEPVREGTEDQAEVAIPETVAVEGMAVETQSFEQSTVEAPETHILNGNGHSAIKEETIETLDDATFAENLTSEDDIKAEPKIMEPIHHISPETLEAPLSTTEYQED
ncbi:hypothetical protein BYT27DRAFT_6511083 [Phlegmacium glaucopus]|nr:hypothetical protein BYT27DRAFT_6511083 [Phlegmacium glaucopus]